MGTSTIHRSPNTARWRYVHSMYADPDADRSRILSEILNAATGYVDGLTDAAVHARLEALLQLDRARLADSEDPIGVATDIVREAQALGRAAGLVSFYGDLADRALFATLARGAADASILASPSTAISTFSRELVGFAVDHLVSRDLTSRLGTGALVDAGSAIDLRGELIAAAQRLMDVPAVSERALAAASAPRRAWRDLIATAWRTGRDLPRSE